MAAPLSQLRIRAKELGISGPIVRGADRDELQTLIDMRENAANGKPRKKSAVKAVRTTVRKKSATKSAPAKSRKSGTAKRQTTRPAARKSTQAKRSNGYVAKGGRYVLEGVDYGITEGWNPRPDSAPDLIVKALKKFRGNREKVFDALKGDIGKFVKPKKSDGSKWASGEGPGTRLGMLKYRIARTAWQFALQTDQHEKATNRVEYGQGGTGTGVWKPARKTRSTATASSKRGRKAKTGAKSRPARKTAEKPAQARKRKTATKSTTAARKRKTATARKSKTSTARKTRSARRSR